MEADRDAPRIVDRSRLGKALLVQRRREVVVAPVECERTKVDERAGDAGRVACCPVKLEPLLRETRRGFPVTLPARQVAGGTQRLVTQFGSPALDSSASSSQYRLAPVAVQVPENMQGTGERADVVSAASAQISAARMLGLRLESRQPRELVAARQLRPLLGEREEVPAPPLEFLSSSMLCRQSSAYSLIVSRCQTARCLLPPAGEAGSCRRARRVLENVGSPANPQTATAASIVQPPTNTASRPKSALSSSENGS